MLKKILQYGLGASITGLFCCVAPAIMFALGLGSGVWAFSYADFFYNADGSANLYGWLLRTLGVGIIFVGIYRYNKKESCSLNTPRQQMINKMVFSITLSLLAVGLYFLFTKLTTDYFEVIELQRQIEYNK